MNACSPKANLSAIGLCELDDAALLRYGIVARYLCDPKTNYTTEPGASLVVRLEEVRREWKRRHPDLPLSDSLG
jgi:hypothetical protein